MDVWTQVLKVVGSKAGGKTLETFLKHLVFERIDGNTIHLLVPNENFREQFLQNYAQLLENSASEVMRAPVVLSIRVKAPASGDTDAPAAGPPETGPAVPALNSRYTFDSFVVGSSNECASAAAMAVAERPSKAYNPLYVYGGSGLGKTHLMQAMGHFILGRNPRVRLSYVSCEQFTNELIKTIRLDQLSQFRQRYRQVDVLLMDDVQFIAGRERTQEEFFQTFNDLYDGQKQIVITSDCPPREIPTMEEKLHSRFEWGMIAGIRPPDLETKIAILRKKADSENLGRLPDETVTCIAGSVGANVRELEGALIRLSARASLEGIDPGDIDVGYATEVLKDFIAGDRRAVSVEMVIRAVSSYYGLRPAQLKSKNNSRPIAQPRQIAMYICKQLTPLSLPQIGKDFGGKHHTTVLHSIRKIDLLKKKDAGVSEAVERILQSIR
jgi:chromosomal replication initiator protein